MSNLSTASTTNPNIEIVYPTLELLDEHKHYTTTDLVKEINKLKEKYANLESKR